MSAIYHATDNQRLAILKSSDYNIIRCICECALNILMGNIPVENKQLGKLKKFKNIIINVVKEKSKVVKKEKNHSTTRRWAFFTPDTCTCCRNTFSTTFKKIKLWSTLGKW